MKKNATLRANRQIGQERKTQPIGETRDGSYTTHWVSKSLVRLNGGSSLEAKNFVRNGRRHLCYAIKVRHQSGNCNFSHEHKRCSICRYADMQNTLLPQKVQESGSNRCKEKASAAIQNLAHYNAANRVSIAAAAGATPAITELAISQSATAEGKSRAEQSKQVA